MWKKYTLFLFVLAALAMVTSCDLAGPEAPGVPGVPGIPGVPFVAPDMGGPSALAPSGGTPPGNQTEARVLFRDALWAFQGAIMTGGTTQTPNTSIQGGRFMVTHPIADTISWVGPGPGGEGTVHITGSVTGSTSFPDYQIFTPQPNTTYNDLEKFSVVMDVQGTVSGIVVTDSIPVQAITYTMSGRMDVDGSFGMDVDVTFGQTVDISSSILNFSFEWRAGYALSIRRADGVGAKFILSYAHRVSRSGIPLNPFSDFPVDDALFDELGTATLRVYDDANHLLFEIPVSLSEVSGI